MAYSPPARAKRYLPWLAYLNWPPILTSGAFLGLVLVCYYESATPLPYLWFTLALLLWVPFLHALLSRVLERTSPLPTFQDIPHILLDGLVLGLCCLVIGLNVVPSLIMVFILGLTLIDKRRPLLWGVLFLSTLVGGWISVHFLLMPLHMSSSSITVTIISFAIFGLLLSLELSDHQTHYATLQQYTQTKEQELANWRFMANTISRYAPTQLWESMLAGRYNPKFENRRRKLTIFFSDIAGFTELSERLSSDELAEFLDTYFGHMTVIADKYGGTIDKFVGDGLVIFFGDPKTQGEQHDALNAVKMALTMQHEIKVLTQRWQAQGFNGLHVRMGLSSGYCHVGNFGSKTRMNYTILGREANLAARLESEAGLGEIFISNATYLLVRQHVHCISEGALTLKGLAQPVQTWRVVDLFENIGNLKRTWFEYEADGFNVQVNLNDIKTYDIDRIRQKIKELERYLNQQTPQS